MKQHTFVPGTLEVIVRCSAKSSYGNITDYNLYNVMKVKAPELRDTLNALYKEGLITVKSLEKYKLITPTPKAYAICHVSFVKVPKETCMKVFSDILKYETLNERYINVSLATLERCTGMQVGVLTLGNALDKLEGAGYVTSKRLSDKMTVYTTTKLGRDRLANVASK